MYRGCIPPKELGPRPLLVPLEYHVRSRSPPHSVQAEGRPAQASSQIHSQLLALQPKR